jgi:predicted nucleic acid-binding protein
MKRALLDTSVVVAIAHEGLEINDPPDEATISVVTLCELHHGVLTASDVTRPGRLRGLDWARHHLEALAVDDNVAPRFGQLMAEARRTTGARPSVSDTLIAATAMLHNLPILARDRDFKIFQGVEIVLV